MYSTSIPTGSISVQCGQVSGNQSPIQTTETLSQELFTGKKNYDVESEVVRRVYAKGYNWVERKDRDDGDTNWTVNQTELTSRVVVNAR